MPPDLNQILRSIVPDLDAASRRSGPGGWRLLWEARATIRVGSGHRLHVDVDGGVRVERLLARPNGPAFRFAVGAGPGEAIALALGTSCLALPTWPELVSHLVTALALRQRAVAGQIAAHAAEPGEGELQPETLETLGRARVLAGPDIEPCADLAIGHRIRIVEAGGRRTGSALFAEGGALPVPAAGSWVLAGRGEPLSAELTDRIVLSGGAAGWAAHEFGHAALELASGSPWGLGIRILDDPRSAAWPAGFSVDDTGRKAAMSDLGLGQRASSRRPSVREPATPSLSFTSLQITDHRWCQRGDLAPGTLVVDSVRAGRFDAGTRTIVLEAERFYRLHHDGTLGDTGTAGLVVLDERAWMSIHGVIDLPQTRPEPAVCTRAGAMNAVMVGAPTITLEPARLIPLNGPLDGEKQG